MTHEDRTPTSTAETRRSGFTEQALLKSTFYRSLLLFVLGYFYAGPLLPLCCGQSASGANSTEHLRDAAQFVVRGDLKRAEDEIQMVLANNPEDYRALNLLGIVRAQQQRRDEAQKLFLQVVRMKPDYAGAHVSLGLLYSETNRPDQAIAEFESALHLDPKREDAAKPLVELLRAQAHGALKEDQPEKSLSLFIRARKISPDDQQLNYEFGIVALRMALYEDARAAFEQVLRSDPANASAIYALARAQIGLAKIPDARKQFEDYVRLRPDDPAGYFGLGLVLHMLEASDDSRRQFEKSIELQPAQTESYVQLGFLSLESGSLDFAEKQFRAALERDPQNAGALLGAGRVQFQRKDYRSAADSLNAALAADSSARETHYYLGLTYARLGKSKESAEQLEIASRMEREDLDRQRIILKLLDPAQADAIEKSRQTP